MLYGFAYLLMNLFRTYVIYLLIGLRVDKKGVEGKKEVIVYGIYYVVISVAYLLLDIALLTLILNIVGIAAILFLYHTSVPQKLLITVFVIGILLVSESIVSVLTGYIDFSIYDKGYYSSFFGLLCVPILPYAVAIFLKAFKKNKRQNVILPAVYLSAIVIGPGASIIIIVTLFSATGLSIPQILASTILLLAVNIGFFSLYERQEELFEKDKEQEVLKTLNSSYEKQFQVMQISNRKTSRMRHDLNNHMTTLNYLAESKDFAELEKYLQKMNKDTVVAGEYIKSNNLAIDSILNHKIAEAEQKGIECDFEVSIPVELRIEPTDLTSILGNLLDNAMEAVKELEDGQKKIGGIVRYDRGRLVINIRNPYKGKLKYEGDRLKTSKKDKDNHGIGLDSVKSAIDRYSGILLLESEKGIFDAHILLFVNPV